MRIESGVRNRSHYICLTFVSGWLAYGGADDGPRVSGFPFAPIWSLNSPRVCSRIPIAGRRNESFSACSHQISRVQLTPVAEV